MKLTEMSVVDLLAAVRSPRPTPGGGSASALAGAFGASLLAMVASMPRHRAESAEEVDSLQAAGRRCHELSERLTALVDQDSAAYDLVVAAYRLPKASDVEKSERSQRIQEALRSAVEAPLDVMRRCAEAVEAVRVVEAFGSPNATSDVGVALELLAAGLRGARLNV
ncbi:MAG: cyclodeaminase/cyclohydrolase family protein, partial [Vicinamibacterales bacterium]